QGFDGRYDVAIKDGRVAAVARDIPADQAQEVVDVSGKIVTPGLIDLHVHAYWGGTFWGVDVDPVAAQTGVTTSVDAGSSGSDNFRAFRHFYMDRTVSRLIGYLNISAIGL